MPINIAVIPSDGEIMDLCPFHGLRFSTFSLNDGKTVVVFMGYFYDKEVEYPVAFCKSYDDGNQILTAIQKGMATGQRIVDVRQWAFRPDRAMLEQLQGSKP